MWRICIKVLCGSIAEWSRFQNLIHRSIMWKKNATLFPVSFLIVFMWQTSFLFGNLEAQGPQGYKESFYVFPIVLIKIDNASDVPLEAECYARDVPSERDFKIMQPGQTYIQTFTSFLMKRECIMKWGTSSRKFTGYNHWKSKDGTRQKWVRHYTVNATGLYYRNSKGGLSRYILWK